LTKRIDLSATKKALENNLGRFWLSDGTLRSQYFHDDATELPLWKGDKVWC
jgi:hypothetical protein